MGALAPPHTGGEGMPRESRHSQAVAAGDLAIGLSFGRPKITSPSTKARTNPSRARMRQPILDRDLERWEVVLAFLER